MNPLSVFYCRCFQGLLRFGMHFVKIPEPAVENGKGAFAQIVPFLEKRKASHPLVVVGEHAYASGRTKPLQEALEGKVSYSVYAKGKEDPTIKEVEDAYQVYQKEGCNSLVAFGGGSILDLAKALGARVSNPKVPLRKMKGVLKIRHPLPPLIAIPTTAGTGSEATLAAVVTDEQNGDKYAINDPKLVPALALFDSSLLLSLPPKQIAYSGLDALTHAVESFLGNSSTKKTEKDALTSARLIFENLLPFYENPKDEEAATRMLEASYLAGLSFTRAYVGYVHALAHAIGGYYHLPHGLLCALILPKVLKAYGKKAERKLSRLETVRCPEKRGSDPELAQDFLTWLKSFERQLGIPEKLDHVIRREDLDALSRHAAKEANPLYPVPKELSAKELKQILIDCDVAFEGQAE